MIRYDCVLYLDESSDKSDLKEFLEEALIMKGLDHVNVLSLFGICFLRDKPHVVLPFMANNDLLSFVRDARHVSTTVYSLSRNIATFTRTSIFVVVF